MWTPEYIGTAIAGAGIGIVLIYRYLQGLKDKASTPTVIGGLVLDGNQADRLIEQVRRIADALTDKQAAEMTTKLDHLQQQMEVMSKRRRPPD